MFNHLNLGNNKALKECELGNLGKIKVICGKNNSGKSTLLETTKTLSPHFVKHHKRASGFIKNPASWFRLVVVICWAMQRYAASGGDIALRVLALLRWKSTVNLAHHANI